MITILDLAKQCPCDPTTIRKWIKKNKIPTNKIKSSNGRLVQAISNEFAESFSNYWKQATTIPEGMILLLEVANQVKVDRRTVRKWANRNNVQCDCLSRSDGPQCHIIKIEDAIKFKEEYTSENKVPVTYFLKEYNTDWRVIRRWAAKNNCKITRTPSINDSKNNLSICKEDANRLEKYLMKMKSDGFFYFIQPVPELTINRIKLGFSKCVNNRIKQHKCICPNAILVKKWKCQKSDEARIRNLVTKGCKRLYTNINNKKCATEVFDCEDYKVVLEKLDEAFNNE